MTSGKSLPTIEDEILAFAILCLQEEAIDLSEFRAWLKARGRRQRSQFATALGINIRRRSPRDIGNIMSYQARRTFTQAERQAVIGIAYERGIAPFGAMVSAAQATRALRRATHIRSEFLRTFTSISI